MKQYLAGKIRNVALAGHSSSGKTTLAEALLFKTGYSDRLGKVADGNTVCDFDPEEIKRKGSVSSTVAPFAWGSTKINLIDTPGLFDFEGGMYEGMIAAESVLITVSARDGVEVGTEKAYDLADRLGRAKMFFVTQMDMENADFYKVLEQLKAQFGPSVCPLVVPFMKDGKVDCYINLIDNKAYRYEGGVIAEAEMPDTGHRLEGLAAAMSEAIAETDEALFEKYFSGEQFTRDEILHGIHQGVKSGSIAPVFCGSAVTLDGIDMLLDAMVDHLPSAYESAGLVAENEAGEPVDVPCTDEAPLAVLVFKTVADPFVGKLSYVKVVSGKITSDTELYNMRTGNVERLGKLLHTRGKKQEETTVISAGDIGAITKLPEGYIREASELQKLMAYKDDAAFLKKLAQVKKENKVKFAELVFPKPTLSMAVVAKNKADEGKVAQSMQRLIEEDPTIRFVQNKETRQQVLTGLGDQHLDVIVSKLANKFGVEINLEKAKVPYRETIQKKVKVQGRHKKQSGGHGQFGDVWIEFEPCDSETLVFEENVFGGAVPKNYFPAVEKGLQECVQKGVLAGYPVVGLKATLVDGSYHPVDSSEMAFKTAASIAYKTALPQASPAILEPIGNLKVTVPDSYTGDIMGDLNKRRGRVLGMEPAGKGLTTIESDVPMSEMGDFTTVLRSITQGRGSFELDFARYELLPKQLEEKVVAEAGKQAE